MDVPQPTDPLVPLLQVSSTSSSNVLVPSPIPQLEVASPAVALICQLVNSRESVPIMHDLARMIQRYKSANGSTILAVHLPTHLHSICSNIGEAQDFAKSLHNINSVYIFDDRDRLRAVSAHDLGRTELIPRVILFNDGTEDIKSFIAAGVDRETPASQPEVSWENEDEF